VVRTEGDRVEATRGVCNVKKDALQSVWFLGIRGEPCAVSCRSCLPDQLRAACVKCICRAGRFRGGRSLSPALRLTNS
jgi:hypothetical protein